jgi:hypothetical protein
MIQINKKLDDTKRQIGEYKQNLKRKAEEQRILSNAKKGMQKERVEQRAERIKKYVKVNKKIYTPIQKSFEKIAKSGKYSKKLSESLLSYGSGLTGGQQYQKKAGPGRPANVYKWRSPFTGRPITAPQYYKEVRAFRRIQEQRAEQAQAQQIKQMAQRGVNPQQLAQMQVQRQIQQPMPQQIRPLPAQLMQQPQTNAVRPIWNTQITYGEETDIMGNRRQVIRGNDARSFWN